MTLMQLFLICRGSGITTYAFQRAKKLKSPQFNSQWDSDGYPKYVEVGWTNWKRRRKSKRGKLHWLRLHRNYLDSRFCPVMWLLTYHRAAGITSGPSFNGWHCEDIPNHTRMSAIAYSKR